MNNQNPNFFSSFKFNLLIIVTNIVILILTLILSTALSSLQINIIIGVLISLIISLIAISAIAFYFLTSLFDDHSNKQEDLVITLAHKYFQKTIPAFDNKSVRELEEKAKTIYICSPDLADDYKEFYQTVLKNLKNDKRYFYIIPNNNDLIGKMDRLIESLQSNLKKHKELKLNYTTTNSPIIVELFVYDIPKQDLIAFVEVQLDSDKNNPTNIQLTSSEAYNLKSWFDKKFNIKSNDQT